MKPSGLKSLIGATSLVFGIMSALAQSDLCIQLNNGVIGHWSGDGITSSSTNKYPAQWVGGSAYVPGVVNQAFSFDGAARYLKVTGNRVLIGARSYEAWVMPRRNTGLGLPIVVGGIPGAGDLLQTVHSPEPLDSPDGSELSFEHWGYQGVSSGLRIKSEQWNHVALTYDGAIVTFYINGVRGNSYSRIFFDYPLSTLTVGGNTIGGTTARSRFAGAIDEVAIYDRALTEFEVRSIYAAKSNPILRTGNLALTPVDGITQQPGVLISWPTTLTNGLVVVQGTYSLKEPIQWANLNCFPAAKGFPSEFFQRSDSGARFFRLLQQQ